MAAPRNYVAKLPFRLRMLVAHALLDGWSYADINELLARNGRTKRLHNNSIGAYRDSDEYKQFVSLKLAAAVENPPLPFALTNEDA